MSGVNSLSINEGINNGEVQVNEYWLSDQPEAKSWWSNTNWFRPGQDSALKESHAVRGNAPNAILKRSNSDQSDQIDALVADSAKYNNRTGGANVFNRFVTQVEKPTIPKTKSNQRDIKQSRAQKIEKLVRNLGYDQEVVRQLNELVVMPLFHPTLFKSLGVRSARGILLTGASGSGKTTLVNELLDIVSSVYVRRISAADLIEHMTKFLRATRREDINGKGRVNGKNSRSENPLCVLFDSIRKHQPSVLFIDQLELIAGSGDSQLAQNREDVAVLHLRAMLALEFDNLARAPTDVIVLAVTNDPTQICSSLLRAGRFEKQIALRRPDEAQRLQSLLHLTTTMKLHPDPEQRKNILKFVAQKTEGYLLADLDGLCREAGLECLREVLAMPASEARVKKALDRESWIDDDGREVKRTNSHYLFRPRDSAQEPEDSTEDLLARVTVEKRHFTAALARLQPSSMRELNVVKPNVKAEDIGGYDVVKQKLMEMVEYPMKHTSLYTKFRLPTASGVLLYGPPGCGKTSLAKMVATICGCRFLSVKGPELLSSYMGQSEANVRQLFSKARENAPCVLFFDEIDAISIKRSSYSDPTISRVVAQLLIEMESSRQQKERSSASSSSSSSSSALHDAIFIIAATNRPDMMDDAFLRPGRLDQLVYVGLPNVEGRASILQACLRNTPKQPNVNTKLLAEMATACHRFSGADLNGLCNMARQLAVRECIARGIENIEQEVEEDVGISEDHLRIAMASCKASVSQQDEQKFLVYNMQRGTYGKALESVANGSKGDLMDVETMLSHALQSESNSQQKDKTHRKIGKKKKASTERKRVANRASR